LPSTAYFATPGEVVGLIGRTARKDDDPMSSPASRRRRRIGPFGDDASTVGRWRAGRAPARAIVAAVELFEEMTVWITCSSSDDQSRWPYHRPGPPRTPADRARQEVVEELSSAA
jgi:hypothetical protein